MSLVLSLFPGPVDLLGLAFELEGFSVVHGPDIVHGRDVRDFHVPPGGFDGVIGGPPCTPLSPLSGGTSKAVDLIPEFLRVVGEAKPDWFLMENVVGAPLPSLVGYIVQDETINDRWLGEEQSRLRRFSLGARRGAVGRFTTDVDHVALENAVKSGCFTANGTQWEPGVDTKRGRMRGRSRSVRTVAELRRGLRLQGLPETWLDLTPWRVEQAIRAIGNGVPVPMGARRRERSQASTRARHGGSMRLRPKRFASEAAFLDALREVLGLGPLIGREASGPTHHDAWPPPSDGCRQRGKSERVRVGRMG